MSDDINIPEDAEPVVQPDKVPKRDRPGAIKNTTELIIYWITISGGTSQNAITSLESIWTLHVVVGQSSLEITLGNQISWLQEQSAAFPSTRRADEVL